jgi:hypothetical protein
VQQGGGIANVPPLLFLKYMEVVIMRKSIKQLLAIFLIVLFFLLCFPPQSAARASAMDTAGQQTAQEDKAGDGAKLPQTGQLWWPVPVLAAAGLVLVLAGREIDRRQKEDHEVDR